MPKRRDVISAGGDLLRRAADLGRDGPNCGRPIDDARLSNGSKRRRDAIGLDDGDRGHDDGAAAANDAVRPDQHLGTMMPVSHASLFGMSSKLFANLGRMQRERGAELAWRATLSHFGVSHQSQDDKNSPHDRFPLSLINVILAQPDVAVI